MIDTYRYCTIKKNILILLIKKDRKIPIIELSVRVEVYYRIFKGIGRRVINRVI